ncbi:MAG: FMN-binding protein [Betaproteobacteria bacterium]|nr:FMN-binding protein [Betaproteobacteria bacterium]
MRWTPVAIIPLAALAGAPVTVCAATKVFLSVEQAQQAMFPGQALKQSPVFLTEAQSDAMRSASSVRHPFRGDRVWQTSDGGWFVVDEVLGKHEMITYAVGINSDGRLRQIEVLEYRESYGYQVAEPIWRQQFVGKTAASTLKLGEDIKNISGATLSCKHLTDGVKRVMVMHQLALRGAVGR